LYNSSSSITFILVISSFWQSGGTHCSQIDTSLKSYMILFERCIHLRTIYTPTSPKWFEFFMANLYTHFMPPCQFLEFSDHFTILFFFIRVTKIQVQIIPKKALNFPSNFRMSTYVEHIFLYIFLYNFSILFDMTCSTSSSYFTKLRRKSFKR
jgi:hypothetical protein